jgi:hypothetical protein
MSKKTFPQFVSPMMAESAKTPFDSPEWIFEIKLDGYRAITGFNAASEPTSDLETGGGFGDRSYGHYDTPTKS